MERNEAQAMGPSGHLRLFDAVLAILLGAFLALAFLTTRSVLRTLAANRDAASRTYARSVASLSDAGAWAASDMDRDGLMARTRLRSAPSSIAAAAPAVRGPDGRTYDLLIGPSGTEDLSARVLSFTAAICPLPGSSDQGCLTLR